ncbi:unnamed protein product, partial [Prorocentrum cordatum]
ERRTLLHLAAQGGSEEVLEVLLQHPTAQRHLDARDSARRTPVHLAAAMGFDGCVQRLLEARAAMEKHDVDGSTPLLLATRFEWPDVVRLLLKVGSNPLDRNKCGQCSADLAVLKEDRELVPIILDVAQKRQPSGGWGALLHKFREKLASEGHEEVTDANLEGGGEAQSGAAGELSDVEIHLRSRSVSPAEPLFKGTIGSGVGCLAGPLMRRGPAAAPQLQTAAVRRHAFFPEGTARLGCEVEWRADQPRVAGVSANGQAERCGLKPADRIVEIASTRTSGKCRDELLPLLKVRPLMIKVDRDEPVGLDEPHVQILLSIGREFEELGLQLAKLGALPVVSRVEVDSDAWAAGLLEGDAILRVSGQLTTGLSRATMTSLVENRGEITIWRRPLGMDLATPWKEVQGPGCSE